MNLQQLEYIIAVDAYRHFAKAAEKCFVTQPTLSMMIQKLEEELDLKIFDRSVQPVVPTKEGEEVIQRAKRIITQTNHLKNYANELKGNISGELRLGIIPTLAPYLLPLFLTSFHAKYPQLKIFMKEMITDDIIKKLTNGELDAGLCATPIDDKQLLEYPLFYEEFFVYASKEEKLPKKKYLLPKQIDVNHLWLLEEGHCLRNQVFNLCELKKRDREGLNYEAGSIETLVNLVDRNHGITIIPQLAEMNLTAPQRKNIREFANPKPVREISLVVNRNFPRKKILDHLKEEILSVIPQKFLLRKQGKTKTIDI
jgi:LysR family hydrogen peroxide-inducible transcriptional activator